MLFYDNNMSKITLTTSIVINHCYGGFSLSNKVALELAQRKGLSLKKDGQFLVVEGDFGNGRAIEDCFPRNDPDLLNLVAMRPMASAQNWKSKPCM